MILFFFFFLLHDLQSLPRKFLSEYIKAIEILGKYRVQQSGLDLFFFFFQLFLLDSSIKYETSSLGELVTLHQHI